MKHENGKLKTPSEDRIFNVDPTGLTPVSPVVKNGILLHKLRAQVHKNILKQKELFYKNSLC